MIECVIMGLRDFSVCIYRASIILDCTCYIGMSNYFHLAKLIFALRLQSFATVTGLY